MQLQQRRRARWWMAHLAAPAAVQHQVLQLQELELDLDLDLHHLLLAQGAGSASSARRPPQGAPP